MKRIQHFIAIALLLGSLTVVAQDGKRDKIRSAKIAFLTEALALTPAEAEKFWPLYNAYDAKQSDIRAKKIRRTRQSEPESLTDKEAQEILSQMEETEAQLYESRRQFTKSLKGVISPVKILKLRKAEDEFNRKLLRQYRKKG